MEDVGDKPDVLYKKDRLELLNIAAKHNLNISDSHYVTKYKICYYIEHSSHSWQEVFISSWRFLCIVFYLFRCFEFIYYQLGLVN